MAPRARKSVSGTAAPQSLDTSVITQAVGGETEAQMQVFDQQRSMIAKLARERSEQGLSFEDLVQEGSVGLLAAMHEYAGGVADPFETYARRRVAEQMDSALQTEKAARREEEQLVADAHAFEAADLKLRRELGRAATPEEIRLQLGWTPDRLDEVASAVEDARRKHDEDLLDYLEPADVDLDGIGPENEEDGAGPEVLVQKQSEDRAEIRSHARRESDAEGEPDEGAPR